MAVPNTFTDGTPALADEVNENFTDVDGRVTTVEADLADAVADRGVELGYAERTTNFTAAAAAAEDVPSLSITVTEGDRPYYVEFETYLLNGLSSDLAAYAVITDAANTTLATAAVVPRAVAAVPTGGIGRCRVRITPTAPGTVKTYKVRTIGQGAQRPTVSAATTAKATLTAIEA